jgi:hypothetical protein
MTVVEAGGMVLLFCSTSASCRAAMAKAGEEMVNAATEFTRGVGDMLSRMEVRRAAEKAGKAIIERIRQAARTAAQESGQHTWPRDAARALEQAASEAEKAGMLPEFVEKLRSMADTMRRREAGHRGGITGRGPK